MADPILHQHRFGYRFDVMGWAKYLESEANDFLSDNDIICDLEILKELVEVLEKCWSSANKLIFLRAIQELIDECIQILLTQESSINSHSSDSSIEIKEFLVSDRSQSSQNSNDTVMHGDSDLDKDLRQNLIKLHTQVTGFIETKPSLLGRIIGFIPNLIARCIDHIFGYDNYDLTQYKKNKVSSAPVIHDVRSGKFNYGRCNAYITKVLQGDKLLRQESSVVDNGDRLEFNDNPLGFSMRIKNQFTDLMSEEQPLDASQISEIEQRFSR